MVVTTMSKPAAPTHDERPWRKRRPVLSRVVLYVLGIALVGGLLLLWSQRADENEEDMLDVLRKRLRGMPATLLPIPEGEEEILRLLETDDFTDPTLPDDVKSIVERTRALAFRAYLKEEGNEATVRRRVAKALTLARKLAPPLEQQAIVLEWAEATIESGSAEGVRELLADPTVRWTAEPALILRNYLEAAVLVEEGDRDAAIQHMEKYLSALKAPLSMEQHAIEIGGRPWSPAEAALEVTIKLDSIRGGKHDPRIWQRLQRLAPVLCLAQMHIAAAFAAMEREELAVSAYKTAVELDKDEARARLDRDEDMKPLKALLDKKPSLLK